MASLLRTSAACSLRSTSSVAYRSRAVRSYATVTPRNNASAASAAPTPETDNGATYERFFPDEPTKPTVRTDIPGPKSQAAIKELDAIFDIKSLNMICDYQRSHGNYLSDMDGNKYLDVYAQIASIPVGYSNLALIKEAVKPEMISALVNRPAIGNFPSGDYASILKTGIMSVAPKGLNQVFTAMAGSDANETAYKAAFMYQRRLQRGEDQEFTEEEMTSSMVNQKPGSPDLAIMSFTKGFHGRLFGSLSTTRSKPIHKMDIPSFNWPSARFPQLKYPLEDNIEANKKEEAECLADVERLIKEWHCPISAVVVEPIQAEGGDNHASPEFFQGVREITKKHGVLLIVDEVQTGVGATGKFWAHDHWNLSTPPDMVTFSKKAQTAGYYFGNSMLRPSKPYRQFNTWMGDPTKALLFRAIIREIERLDLVNNTARTGEYLHNELERLSKVYPEEIQNLRGKGLGTFIAWDSPQRDALLMKMKKKGVNIGGSGERAIRLRPMLVFQKHHADIFLETLDSVFKG